MPDHDLPLVPLVGHLTPSRIADGRGEGAAAEHLEEVLIQLHLMLVGDDPGFDGALLVDGGHCGAAQLHLVTLEPGHLHHRVLLINACTLWCRSAGAGGSSNWGGASAGGGATATGTA